MKQWGFYFDQSRCIACKTCTVACKEWNSGARGDAFNKYDTATNYATGGKVKLPDVAERRKYYMKEDWRRVTSEEYGTLPPDVDVMNQSISCNHCDKPACLEVCPVGAITKDAENGIVIGNAEKCISCGSCKDACPWGAPQYYDDPSKYKDDSAEMPKMTKCTLCHDRISEGLKPACVAACVNRALDADEVSILKAKYKDAKFREMAGFDKNETGPNIFFKAKKCRVKI